MTNQQVKRAFMEGRYGKATNLLSTGLALLSYGWWEVARWIDGEIVTRRGRSCSQTTARRHRSGVHGRQASVDTPVSQGEMNY